MKTNLKQSFNGFLCILLLICCSVSAAAQINPVEVPENRFNISEENRATVDSLETYVNDLIRNNQLADAHKWAKKGIRLAKKLSYRQGEFELLLLNAYQFLNRNMNDSTIAYSERALELADTDNQKRKAMNSLANGYANKGQSIIAIDMYEQVLALSDSLENEEYIIGVLSNLATAYGLQGKFDEALKYYFDALERSEKIENDEYTAIITNNLGDKFSETENLDQAEFYLNRSKKLSRRIDLKSNLVRVYLNLGNLYKDTERFREAEESYKKALEMNRSAGNLPGEIQVIFNMGEMYLAKKDYSLARSYLEQSLNQSLEIDLKMGIYYGKMGLGDLEFELGNYNAATANYRDASDVSENFDNNRQKLAAYNKLYQSYKRAGNQTQALSWLEKVNDLSREVRSAEKERLTAQYETKFNLRRSEQEKQIIELKQKQQEAQLEQQKLVIMLAFFGIIILLIAGAVLIRSNRKRKLANLELIESNKRLQNLNKTNEQQKQELERLNNIKTKLFAIIAHDLRGPLSSLQSLLYLLREHDLSVEEEQKLITNLEKNMLDNSSMMDNLLGWAKSQMNGISVNKRRFDLLHCVESVLEQFKLQADSKDIHFDIDVPENSYTFADYDLLKLVIRNLVANAIKFSHNNSTIRIGANKTADSAHTYKVFIEDHGVGISKENRSKIFTDDFFTSYGTDREKGTGLGLNLCKEYIEKHGESIWFETEEGEGTTFYFTIPADKKEELVGV